VAAPRMLARPSGRIMDKVKPYLFLMPALLFVGCFLVYPAFTTFSVSFTEWNGINVSKMVGLDNYRFLVTDPAFWKSFYNTVFWVLGSLVFPVTLGLFAALMLFGLPGERLFKVVIFMPYALSGVVIAIVWSYMYKFEGAINTILAGFVDKSRLQPWLQIVPINTLAMIITYGWRMTGTNMVLFSVGMLAIPDEPIEAARIEGASYFQILWKVIIPMLASTTAVVVVMAIINSLNIFDIIWIMTQGGPYRSSATLGVNMYFESFLNFNFGHGAANATVLSVIVMAASVFYIKVIFKKREIGG
jgi:ABC-type sugar transport system permease subunit